MLEVVGYVSQALQVLDVRAVLEGLGGLAVDDRDLAGLGHALTRSLDHGLVDSLLDDLVAHVVRAIDIEPLLVETEPDRERSVLDQDQVRGLERHRKLITKLMSADGDSARQHELPQT